MRACMRACVPNASKITDEGDHAFRCFVHKAEDETVGLSRSAEICIRVSRLLTFTSISQVMK